VKFSVALVNPFHAMVDRAAEHEWLDNVGRNSVYAFMRGVASEKSGRIYAKRNRASAPGEYPARQTGLLLSTTNYEIAGDTLTIGSSAPYASYLQNGTSRMAARKLFNEALTEGMANATVPRAIAKWASGAA
jgi:hypothetical protein